MQTRPYPSDDGKRVWLSRDDRADLLNAVDEQPKRKLAFELGLHGLRSDEVVRVAREDFRPLNGEDGGYKLNIPLEKSGYGRECPVSDSLQSDAEMIANLTGARQGEALVDVSTKSLRDWIATAREKAAEDADTERQRRAWSHVGMHDLRRTWATDTFYTLAFDGVPIAEELTMGWGGWSMTSKGRETFRENYLGPEPDHIAGRAMTTLQSE